MCKLEIFGSFGLVYKLRPKFFIGLLIETSIALTFKGPCYQAAHYGCSSVCGSSKSRKCPDQFETKVLGLQGTGCYLKSTQKPPFSNVGIDFFGPL